MLANIIDLNILPLETLAEMANEAGEQAEKNAKSTVQKAIDAGRYLIAAKEQIEHGNWLTWLGQNWNYTRRQAQTYMEISNAKRASHLTDAKSIREALRMIGEEKAENEPFDAPRSERKTGQVWVVDVEADQPVDPPTIAKTAKGSEKVREDKKPRTQAVVPELLQADDSEEADPVDDWFATRSFEDVCKKWIGDTDDATKKKAAAKHLRRMADVLDPPTKFVRPTIEEVAEYCESRNSQIDPEAFVAFYAANGWKLSNGNKLNDWKAAVITWEKRDNASGKLTQKKDAARIRKRAAQEVRYDE